MANILSFESTPLRHSPTTYATNQIAIAELRSYLPLLSEKIDAWKARKVAKGCNLEEVEYASKALSDCVRCFILSGGRWSGRWPQMATEEKANFLVTDLYLFIMRELLPYSDREFISPICDGLMRAHESNSKPNIRYRRDLRTYQALTGFMAQLSKEECRQANGNGPVKS